MAQLKKIRLLILFFIVALILSGVTAFPVETELRWLLNHPALVPSFAATWLQDVYNALLETNTKYPMLAYGFDWLAFAHIVIAIAFIGSLKDPVKNKWIIDWAMLACVAVFPLAFIAAPIRHIPMFHVLIDCSFGVVGLIPLYFCRKWIKQLEENKMTN
jgi:membrane protease YdiL (CAAX protease family)